VIEKIKHLFGLCREPFEYRDFVRKLMLADSGGVIELPDNCAHWFFKHTAFGYRLKKYPKNTYLVPR